jgi:multiple sugar transport system ATP-binding protein
MVYVTHDQVEAMTLADRIVVLSVGRIEQVGTPLELYEHPCNIFVAGFIGSPKMNFISATFVEGSPNHTLVRLEGGETVRCEVDGSVGQAGERLTLGVRPEHFAMEPLGVGGVAANVLKATVTFVESLGSTTHAYCAFPGVEEDLTVELDGRLRVKSGQVLALSVPANACYLFDAEGHAWRRQVATDRMLAA